MTLHYILYIYYVSHYILIGTLQDLYKFFMGMEVVLYGIWSILCFGFDEFEKTVGYHAVDTYT